jgi:RHS repeat-associated protein
VNGVAYTWDENGNLLSDGVNTYTYDHANRLVSVAGPSSSVSYAYNGLGDRLQQTVDGVTTNYSLDLNNWRTQVLADGTNTYLYGAGRIAQFEASGAAYFLGDALGSVRQVTSESGEITLNQSYSPYGEVLSSQGTAETDFAFTGEMYDPQTGLIFLRARYYSPIQGRFLQRDPWHGSEQKPLTMNPYLYAAGNPTNLLDPSGMWACTGHSDCEDWVKNTLSILSISGDAGRAIVQFFNQHDQRIEGIQLHGYVNPSCQNLPTGVLIEFGDPWPSETWGTAVKIHILQLLNDPEIIKGPNPTGFGVVTFGHEVSHWAQGLIRFTIQGEVLSRFVEEQLRRDLESIYHNIRFGEGTAHIVDSYNPFSRESLHLARNWMVENFNIYYGLMPLGWPGGLDQSWLKRFYVQVQIPPAPPGPQPIPTPPP